MTRTGSLVLSLLTLVAGAAIAGCDGSAPAAPDATTPAEDAGGHDATVVDAGPPPPPSCEGGCRIGDTCFPAGASNPVNRCEVCDPAASATAFSPDDGAACDDGLFCTEGDVCMAGACAGTVRSCDDGIACTSDATCDEDADACGTPTSSCTGDELCDASTGECSLDCTDCAIDGVCYGDGQIDPGNPCRACDAAASRSAWTDADGASCDDGEFCTVDDTCAAGACVGGGARDCDDGVACDGVETCNEDANACARGATTCEPDELCDLATDTCVVTCTGCVIDGTCYGAGQRNPASQCEVCAPAISASAWSPNDGASCDDGLFCTTSDACSGTTCVGVARACGDGIDCNGTETCDEAADACSSGTATCGAGLLCDPSTDVCVTTCSGCVIDGTCYGAGQVSPTNACEVCTPATTRTAWSANDGARCDDGLFCTHADTCSARTCAGTARDCSDGVACNGTETCDEAANVCAAGTGTCAATEVCDVIAGACVPTCAGCVIGGVCHADGSRDPSNACEICDVDRSRVAWSANDGASCDDGAFCTIGDTCSGGLCAGSSTSSFCDDGVACNGVETCSEASDRCVAGAAACAMGQVCDTAADACVTSCTGCVIGGVCHAPGARNPSNECQVCAPASSATAWSTATAASCDDGLFCTTGDVCSAAGVCAGAARSCGDGVSCNGAETCDESADRCAPGTSTCAAGQVCDVAADACRTTCSGCVIAGVCHASGAINPANPCQICRPASSSTAWTANTGASCDDGLFCTTGETCSASAACTDGAPRACGDGVTCNGAETCDESTDRCVGGTSPCTGGRTCNPTTDSCDLMCIGGSTLCGTMCVATSFDPANCGGCGVVCDLPNASAEFCASGTCGVAACTAGFGDCDGAASNGCESRSAIDSANCGGCGRVCATGTFCDAGVCVPGRRVFVTSLIYNANMGGLAGADALCQARADAASLGGTFRAWLGDRTTSVGSRLTHSTVRYVLVDGSVVADDWTDLTDGMLDRPINLTETGGAPPRPDPYILDEPAVWTGSNANGTIPAGVDHCLDWTAGNDGMSHSIMEGRSDVSTAPWTQSRAWSGGPCAIWRRPLYCFQQ